MRIDPGARVAWYDQGVNENAGLFDSERAKAAAERSAEVRRAMSKDPAVQALRKQAKDGAKDDGGLPILRLARDKAIQALRDTDDPRTIASLISGVTRLAPLPKDAGVSEADDELVQRYKRAGYELPYS